VPGGIDRLPHRFGLRLRDPAGFGPIAVPRQNTPAAYGQERGEEVSPNQSLASTAPKGGSRGRSLPRRPRQLSPFGASRRSEFAAIGSLAFTHHPWYALGCTDLGELCEESGNGAMTFEGCQILEGPWEKLLTHADELRGHRVRLIVLPAEAAVAEPAPGDEPALRERVQQLLAEVDRITREPGKPGGDLYEEASQPC